MKSISALAFLTIQTTSAIKTRNALSTATDPEQRFYEAAVMNDDSAMIQLQSTEAEQIEIDDSNKNYEIVNECKMPLHVYIEGTQFFQETTSDGKPMLLISGGQTGRSQLAVLSFSFEKCEVEVVHSTDLPKELYGEGISMIGSTAYELTWRNKKIIEWQVENPEKDLKLVQTHDMGKTDLREGWGLTYNKFDELLYATDGSEYVNVLEPGTFETKARFPVAAFNHKMKNLNEIEVIRGGKYLLMNVYRSNRILLVENGPEGRGEVRQSWDMSELVEKNRQAVYEAGHDEGYKWRLNVLNGIAYHEPTDTFVIGGKDWDLIFFVKLNITV